MADVRFVANIPHVTEDLNNAQQYLVGCMIVHAIATINADGSLKSIDIDQLVWKDYTVTNYVYECHPAIWDSLKDAAEQAYLNNPNNVAS
jgi:hypothetical protein